VRAEIGLVGLGAMGANLALNIAEKGFVVAVYMPGQPRGSLVSIAGQRITGSLTMISARCVARAV
jgi:6-phosphogluconate dehydrogenase